MNDNEFFPDGAQVSPRRYSRGFSIDLLTGFDDHLSRRYRPIRKNRANSVTVLEIGQLVLCKSVRYTWKVVDQCIKKAFAVLFDTIAVSWLKRVINYLNANEFTNVFWYNEFVSERSLVIRQISAIGGRSFLAECKPRPSLFLNHRTSIKQYGILIRFREYIYIYKHKANNVGNLE